jgi:hypothetical protein
MKRVLFIFLLTFSAISGMAQTNSLIGFFAGGGLATAHNYDVALSGGAEFSKAVFNRTWLGITAFYQGYGMLYDKEANGLSNGSGSAGMTILHKSAFVFLAPKITHDIGARGFLKCYLSVGGGFNMGGTETLRKWDRTFGATTGNYDSVINTTANINKMAVRLGVGFVQYIGMGRHWWFTINEDFGFLTSSLSQSSDVTFPSRTTYSPNKLGPGYISLQIGATHTKY